MSWEPSEKIMDWAKNMVRAISEGGTWRIPETGAAYRFFKIKKEIHLITGGLDEYFHKNLKTFGKLGYKVLDRRGITPEDAKLAKNSFQLVTVPFDADVETLREMMPMMLKNISENQTGFLLGIDNFEENPGKLEALFKKIFETGFVACLVVSATLVEPRQSGLGAYEVWMALSYSRLAGLFNQPTNLNDPEFLIDLEAAKQIAMKVKPLSKQDHKDDLGKPMTLEEGQHRIRRIK